MLLLTLKASSALPAFLVLWDFIDGYNHDFIDGYNHLRSYDAFARLLSDSIKSLLPIMHCHSIYASMLERRFEMARVQCVAGISTLLNDCVGSNTQVPFVPLVGA